MPRQKITSRQNERLKQAAKLRDARQRQRQGRIVIDGVREISRAIAAGIVPSEAFLCPALMKSSESQHLATQLDELADFVGVVSSELFAKLAFGNKSDGIVAIAATPQRTLGNLHLGAQPLVAVLEGLEKPGNVGAILRSADGAGFDAVIVCDPGTDLFNPNTVRASVGTVFAAHVCTAAVDETLAWLKRQDLTLVATRPEATRLYYEVDFRGGVAVVLGSEANGLTPAWDEADILSVRLPMQGIADSLNVSTAAAVLFYEARRQRDLGS